MEKSFTPKRDAVASDSSGNGDDEVLSPDELNYLRTLFAVDEPEDSDLTEVGLFASNDSLLALLPELKGLHVSAEHGDYRYIFPLESVQSSGFKLRMQSPRIYDVRGPARSWRAPTEPGMVEVTDPTGSLKRIRVANLSASGLLLVAEAEDALATLKPNAEVRLLLKVPDLPGPMRVTGTVVRCSFDQSRHRQLLAIKFITPDAELEEAICAYLLRAHCERQVPGVSDN